MKQHRLDPLSLLLGLALLVGSGLWLVWDRTDLTRNSVLIAVPAILVVAGLVGIVLSAVTGRRRKEETHE